MRYICDIPMYLPNASRETAMDMAVNHSSYYAESCESWIYIFFWIIFRLRVSEPCCNSIQVLTDNRQT